MIDHREQIFGVRKVFMQIPKSARCGCVVDGGQYKRTQQNELV